jgi:hypothetical protein
MKYLFILLSLLILSCQSSISQEDQSVIVSSSSSAQAPESPCIFLMNFDGKFAYDCNLLENPITGSHLKELLGERYDFLISTWEEEVPIEIQDSVLFTQAYQYDKRDPGAVIMIDIKRNLYTVGVLENGKVKLYFDDSTFYPERLKYWVKHPAK